MSAEEAQSMESLAGGPKGEKYLQIMIYRIEADWALAMDMKKAISNQEGAAGQGQ